MTPVSLLVLAPRGAFLRRDYPFEPRLTIPGRFQALFTPLLGVLFSFRSPYYCAIGLGTYLVLGVDDPQLPARIPTRGTQETPPRSLRSYAYGAITLYGAAFQRTSASPARHWAGSYNTTSTWGFPQVFGLDSAAFGRPYSRHRVCFLFLRVLRCFLSPRSRSLMGASPKGQDIPFGDPRFDGSLRLPEAFRSLARPSSAPEPSHPPAGIHAGNSPVPVCIREQTSARHHMPMSRASTLPRRLFIAGCTG